MKDCGISKLSKQSRNDNNGSPLNTHHHNHNHNHNNNSPKRKYYNSSSSNSNSSISSSNWLFWWCCYCSSSQCTILWIRVCVPFIVFVSLVFTQTYLHLYPQQLPSISLVPIDQYFPCNSNSNSMNNNQSIDTTINTKIVCTTTFMYEHYNSNDEHDDNNNNNNNEDNNSNTINLPGISSDPLIQEAVCNDLVAANSNNGNNNKGILTAPVCIQSHNTLYVAIYYEKWMLSLNFDDYERLRFVQNPSLLTKVLHKELESSSSSNINTNDINDNEQNDNNIVLRPISLKYIDFPIFYNRINDTTNTIYEQYRDNNYGNLVWRYGASTMLNSVTNHISKDNDIHTEERQVAKEQSSLTSSLLRITTTTSVQSSTSVLPPFDALVIASANALHLSEKKVYVELIREKTRYIRERNVKTIVLGIGVQHDFPDTDNNDTDTTTNDSTTTSSGKKNNKNNILNLKTKLKFTHQYQKTYLQEIVNRQHTAAIGVRGDFTRSVCMNSGIKNCISTGCPSLTISRDVNLGLTLHNNWKLVRELLLKTEHGDRQIRIALAAPTSGTSTTYQTAYKFMALLLHQYGYQITVICQSTKDPIRLENYIQSEFSKEYPTTHLLQNGTIQYEEYKNVESWLHNTKKYDVCISFRIHGSMPFISSGVPAIVIPTDYRIMELVSAMKLPYVLPTDIQRVIEWTEVTTYNDSASTSTSTSIILLLMEICKNSNFLQFEINRRNKIKRWKTILDVANIEIDPKLIHIIHTPLLSLSFEE